MAIRPLLTVLFGAYVCLLCTASDASGDDCSQNAVPTISFVSFQSANLTAPQSPLTIKGKLSLPNRGDGHELCVPAKKKWPAVLILHGSGGVDSRGDFYEAALNDAGFAALQIDMWEARGVTGLANRPRAPILTQPDAFSALAFLSAHPNIIADRIGVLGFSWGGVVSLGAAEQLYAALFGGGRTFAAHVANYPVCYGANNPSITAPLTPAQAGTQFLHLTGAPVLIQIGSEDDYDNGTAHCVALANAVNPSNNNAVTVAEYLGAFHAWDRLMVPISGPDPFGNEGSFFSTGILPTVQLIPDVAQAYESRERVIRFFRGNL